MSGPRVLFVRRSGNRKTGPIPVTYTDAKTCPASCGLFRACYAKAGIRTRAPWARAATAGSWARTLHQVAQLPAGTLWRHNVAGDLPGRGGKLARRQLAQLVRASAGRRGFTYTHKPLGTRGAREAIRNANRAGFTVNLSADTLAQADTKAALGIGPVVVVVPAGGARRQATPSGRTVLTCPATYSDRVTCATCQWCAKADRPFIVAFPVHGQRAAEFAP